MDQEDRIALFLDYENLALGAREHLGGMAFDLRPIADALAERGRVVVRRAYADWSYFDEDRRMLTRSHVELIEMPQRMGASRKNAADIKMAVDAVELAFERSYVSTFVICTGDSDFTPLVQKLREPRTSRSSPTWRSPASPPSSAAASCRTSPTSSSASSSPASSSASPVRPPRRSPSASRPSG